MRQREHGRDALSWLAAGAAVLGMATLATRFRRAIPLAAIGGEDQSEASGRGRRVMPPSADARRAGHETKDMRGGLMGKLVLLLGSVAVCMVLAMAGLRYWVTQTHIADQPPLTAMQTSTITPPLPHLQTDPVSELATLQANETKLLHSYAYTDDTRTRARIPIDRAMSLMVGQGLEPPP